AHQERIAPGIFDDDPAVHFPFRLKPALGLIRYAVCDESPNHSLVLGRILRNLHSECPPAAACVEVCRLSLVGAVDIVIGADRNIDFFFCVPVVVTEMKVVGSVRISVPTFISRTDILPACIASLSERELRHRCGRGSADQENCREGRDQTEVLLHSCLSSSRARSSMWSASPFSRRS